MHKVFYSTAVKKDIRVLPDKIRLLVEDSFLILTKNPLIGKFLHGELKGYLSYSLSNQGTEYRIIYQILKEESVILVIMIGSRENLYQRLKRRI